ncbi:O-antigen ligase-like membrane protein [Micromonospora palomenae]|uniref:O-antigen ligase-like membrane protein n=1 Tax=Micromonospora palomenae TaxID=1461247 RepID=A0A561VH55_9ACTN|nr:O-antigen ligase family protein [Micromonospora palomenae]TWG10956.1 O-antigen ligase-like membrane protein [Micromonospora palomenae]
MRELTSKIAGSGRGLLVLSVGLAVLAAWFLVTGRWEWALAVGVGALLGWAMTEPTRIVWAIFVVAFAVPVTIDFGYPTNPSYTLLLVLFILVCWGRVRRAERDGWQRPMVVGALLLPACAVLAGIVHWHGAKPVVVGVAPLLCFGVLGWHLIEEARRDPWTISRVAEALTWFSVAVAVFAKYQTLSRTWPIFDQLAYDWTYTSAFDNTRAVGLSGHPIIYGTFAMAMALVALTLRGRFWYVPFTANLVGLVLSGTRSAWVGMILALATWLFLQWRKVSWRGVGSAVAVAAIAYAVVAVSPSFLPPATPMPASSEAALAPTPAAADPASAAPAPSSGAATPASGAAAPSPAAAAPSSAAPEPSSAAPATRSAAPAPTSAAPAPGTVDAVDVAGSRFSDPASADARFTRISVVWDGITRDWSTVVFGNGPEANVRYLEHVGIGDGQAQVFDNTYLTFWYNYGLIGLACLLSLLVVLFRYLRSVAARVLLVGFAAQVFFFDVWLWLGAVAVLLLAVALGAADHPSLSARPLGALVPGPWRPRTSERTPEENGVPSGVR